MNISYFSKDFIKKLAIPRLVGTEGEKNAQQVIEEELNQLGVSDFEKQPFYYCKFRNHLLRFYDVIMGILMLINIYLLSVDAILVAIPVLAGLFLIAFKSRSIKESISFKVNEKTRKGKSYNYIVNISPKAQERKEKKAKTVVILAHYDSKSLILHPIFEGAIFFFGLAIGSLFSIHGLIVSLLRLFNIIPVVNVIQFVYIFPFIVLYVIETINKTGNESPGANDNACGVACGMFIIDLLKKNRLENTEVIVVFTGAEEVGEIGAYNFMKENSKRLSEKNTYFIVIDSVGGNSKASTCFNGQGLPKRSSSPLIEQSSREVLKANKDLKLDFFYIPPLIPNTTDHTPLKYFGNYEYMVYSSNNRWHSEDDDLDNYHPGMLENFFVFLRDILIKIDEKYLE